MEGAGPALAGEQGGRIGTRREKREGRRWIARGPNHWGQDMSRGIGEEERAGQGRGVGGGGWAAGDKHIARSQDMDCCYGTNQSGPSPGHPQERQPAHTSPHLPTPPHTSPHLLAVCVSVCLTPPHTSSHTSPHPSSNLLTRPLPPSHAAGAAPAAARVWRLPCAAPGSSPSPSATLQRRCWATTHRCGRAGGRVSGWAGERVGG